jgi:peptidoglycan hydrolase-like protein with peptidoglycan-binding domain
VAVIGTPTVLVVAVLVAVGFSTRHTEAAPGPVPVQVATATVTKTNLSDSQTLPGTLGFGSRAAVLSRAEGVITKLPKVGSVPVRGKMLFRANDQPVTVFYGKTPLFRTLRLPAAVTSTVRSVLSPPDPTPTSPTPPTPTTPPRPPAHRPLMHGRDVTVVADNLEKLGYDIGYRPARVAGGDIYTRSLAAAVRRWQKKIGMTATGTLGPSQAIVLPGPVRVESVDSRLGDDAAGMLMNVSSTQKMITVPVEAGALNGISAGDRVQVEMPDSSTIRASVTSVSRKIKSDPDKDAAGENATPTITVSIRPRRASDVDDLDSAPVQVRFSTGLREGVLAAPISALVALRGGGYALQRPDGSLVAVKTGLFADGLVEVKGAGVTAGMSVQTTS